MEIDKLLKNMVEHGASDLHLKAGRPPLLRISGELVPTEFERLTPEDIKFLMYEIMNSEQRRILEEKHELDFGYSIPGFSRFRANVFFQRGTVAAVLRSITFEVPTIDDMGLPEVIKDLALRNAGLLLICGPTGSGKTTTLAAIIEHINLNRQCHIVTVEEPIEYLHRDKMASICQRELGYDTYSYGDALKYILRQDPDVILIGEMRDSDTARIGLRAAETGHLVLTTLHTYDSAQAVERLIGFFPTSEQVQVRMQISLMLNGVIVQRLLRRVEEKVRVAAVEIMTNSPQIQKLIEEGRISAIHDAISTSVAHFRMQTLNQSLVALCLSGEVSAEEAVSVSPNPDEFKRILHDFQGAKPVQSSVEELKV